MVWYVMVGYCMVWYGTIPCCRGQVIIVVTWGMVPVVRILLIIQCHTMPWYTTPYHAIPYHDTPYHALPYLALGTNLHQLELHGQGEDIRTCQEVSWDMSGILTWSRSGHVRRCPGSCQDMGMVNSRRVSNGHHGHHT